MHDFVSTRAGASHALPPRVSPLRANCSGGISYSIFRFEIIHCHYCWFFFSFSKTSYHCPQPTLFIALCRSTTKWYAEARGSVTRESQRTPIPLARAVRIGSRGSRIPFSNAFYFVRHTYQRRRKFSSAEWKLRNLWNHSTVILHVGSPIRCTVRAPVDVIRI